jgi:hypothetical protein
MNQTTGRLARYAPLSGILAAGLAIAGLAVVEASNSTPDSPTAAQALAYVEAHGDAVVLGAWLVALGLVAFYWFLGSLRAALREAEGGSGRLATTAFGGGLAAAVLLVAAIAPTASAAIATMDADHNVSPEAAQAILHVGDAFFPAAFMAMSVPIAATALVALRTGVLPRWFGAVSLVIAVALLIPFVQWLTFGFVFPVWLVLCSLLLTWRRAPRRRVAADPLPA